MYTQSFTIPQFPKIGLTHKNSPQWSRQLSQPTLLRASKARLTGASSKGGKCAESPPTFICGKRRKNRRKPVMMNIPDSGVVDKSGALVPTYPQSKRKSDLCISFKSANQAILFTWKEVLLRRWTLK
ncbi:hypothetical protein HKD37_03G006766 [Glycine soja]